MRLDAPLDDIFLNRSHVRVLRALYGLPEGLAVSGREAGRRARVTHPTALKALALLVETGVVSARRGLSGDLYHVERGHVLADPIARLFDAERHAGEALASVIRQELLARTKHVESATLFGSAVRGGSAPASDVDLAVSCAASHAADVQQALDDVADVVRRRFGNRLSPLVETGKGRRRAGAWKRIDQEGRALIRDGKAVAR